jgi:ribosomal protein S30
MGSAAKKTLQPVGRSNNFLSTSTIGLIARPALRAELKKRNVVQTYSENLKPKGKLSEDNSILLTGIQSLFATDSQITQSNNQLKNAGPHGSMIKLGKIGKGKKTDNIPGKEFYKVMPSFNISAYHARMESTPCSFHKGLLNKEVVPGGFNIWADCRRASEVVTGASALIGTSDKEVRVGTKTFDPYAQKVKRPSNIANDNTTYRLSMQVYAQAIKPFLDQYGVNSMERETFYHLFPEIKISNAKAEYEKAINSASTDISIAERLYSSLKPEYKDLFHRLTKTNQYANPEIGDAYAIITEYGMPGFKESENDWGFHWGGVIMKGGSDNITLENFSVGDENKINSDWKFEMYGTQKPEQSFHHKQIGSGHHGNIATTISVVTKGSQENRGLSEALDKVNAYKKLELSGVDYRKEILASAVLYNELASNLGKEHLTKAMLIGPHRMFAKQDISAIDPLKKKYLPK